MNMFHVTFDCRVFSAGLLVGTILGLIVNVLVISISGNTWIEIGSLCPWCQTNNLQASRTNFRPHWSLRQSVGSITNDIKPDKKDITFDYTDTVFKTEVSCMVMLTGHRNTTRMIVDIVRKTWGRHCNYLTFYQLKVIGENSTKNILDDDTIQTIEIAGTDGYNVKMKNFKLAALLHNLNLHKEIDWFMMVSMPTFVVIENLKYFLRDKRNTNTSRIFADLRQDYLTLDGGILFNRKAASKLVCLEPESLCCANKSNTFSDAINTCFTEDSGTITQPRDKDGRFLFNSMEPSYYFGNRTNQERESDDENGLPSVFAVSFCGKNIQFLIETYSFLYRQETRSIYSQYRTPSFQTT